MTPEKMKFIPGETVRVRCEGQEFEAIFSGPAWEVGPDDNVWVYLHGTDASLRWRTQFPAKMITPQRQLILHFI